jgi:predicted DNA-binding transcriptional regulator YafY
VVTGVQTCALPILKENFLTPEGFNTREFLDDAFQGQPQVNAKLRFTREASHIARLNRTSWEACEEQVDGSVVVVMSAPDLNWATSTVLAFGPLVEVIEPLELRELVLTSARAVVEHYT